MSTAILRTSAKPKLSVKVQTLAALAAIVGAVAVPQIFHALGAVSGLGTSLGEAFLPMHLPIILAGLLAGPYAGAIAGLLGPLASFAVSGMPGIAMLPFMMIELCAYGLFAGLLRNVKLPTIAKVLAVQTAGRAGTGICPMEEAVGELSSPSEALKAVRQKLAQLNSDKRI